MKKGSELGRSSHEKKGNKILSNTREATVQIAL